MPPWIWLKETAAVRRACKTSLSVADPARRKTSLQVIAGPVIEKRILVVRERQVMLDEDLADVRGVETRALVRR